MKFTTESKDGLTGFQSMNDFKASSSVHLPFIVRFLPLKIKGRRLKAMIWDSAEKQNRNNESKLSHRHAPTPSFRPTNDHGPISHSSPFRI